MRRMQGERKGGDGMGIKPEEKINPELEEGTMECNRFKMREALEATIRFLDSLEYEEIEPYSPLDEDASVLRKKIRAALSEPARQCDVGTAEEQSVRYGEFCQRECLSCDKRISCHIRGEAYRMKCMMEWAQAPYAEGRKGEADGHKNDLQ